jgi:hypothetical protein
VNEWATPLDMLAGPHYLCDLYGKKRELPGRRELAELGPLVTNRPLCVAYEPGCYWLVHTRSDGVTEAHYGMHHDGLRLLVPTRFELRPCRLMGWAVEATELSAMPSPTWLRGVALVSLLAAFRHRNEWVWVDRYSKQRDLYQCSTGRFKRPKAARYDT